MLLLFFVNHVVTDHGIVGGFDGVNANVRGVCDDVVVAVVVVFFVCRVLLLLTMLHFIH